VKVVRKGGKYLVEVRSGSTLLRTIRLPRSVSNVIASLKDIDDDGVLDLVITGKKNGKKFAQTYFLT
jgi:hypothetical protein